MDQLDFTNHFLIAMPSMVDSCFSSSIVYICQHNGHGALGLIVNKPIDMDIDDLFLTLGINTKKNRCRGHDVFFGGPVETEYGFIIHRYSRDWRSTIRLTSGMALTTSTDILESIAHGTEIGDFDALISLGCCGWAEGQLEKEIKMSAWLVVPAKAELMFQVPIEERYDSALSSLGIKPEQISIKTGHV
jgi:putative transcriptional regulator